MNNEERVAQIHQMVEDIQSQLSRLKQLIQSDLPFDEMEDIKLEAEEFGAVDHDGDSSIVEGVFDGQNMVGPDGKTYTVPANYASKSKLVEGDLMKLTIQSNGQFLYKQIGPVERARLIGTLVKDADGAGWHVLMENGRSYRLLTASVTYFKGSPGDSVVALMPEDEQSKWAAVENIVPDGEEALLEDGDDMLLESGEDDLLEDGEEGIDWGNSPS